MRLIHPGFKIACIFAALLSVSACASKSDTGGATGTGNGVSTNVGGVVPGSQESLATEAGDSVFFEYDSSSLTAQGQATLQAQARWLATYPSVTLLIEGHCDERGTREYNIALGERRANAARAYLVSLGVDSGRLSTLSYGKDRPFAVGSNDSSWAQNRRAFSRVN